MNRLDGVSDRHALPSIAFDRFHKGAHFGSIFFTFSCLDATADINGINGQRCRRSDVLGIKTARLDNR